MAVQHSPALPPLRPGLIDPSRQAEYPILLGKTFTANRTVNADQLLNIRYNWKSKQIPKRQIITQTRASSGAYQLVVREDHSEPYKYDGSVDPRATYPDSAHLALIFDKQKSAFVLESISRSLNFNLTSANTKPNIEQLPQLETANSIAKDASQSEGQHKLRESDDEDAPDAHNPYDYRHFLAEVKMETEGGSSAPNAPSNGKASPAPGVPRTLTTSKSANPLQSPFMGPSKRRKVEQKPASRGPPRTSNPAASNAPTLESRTSAGTSKSRREHKPADKIAPSDEEQDNQPSARTKPKQARVPPNSQACTPSPQIIVDEASDLTIDMGSPPRKAKLKHKINPGAFSSHSRGQSRAGSASISPQRKDVNSDGDTESDVGMGDSYPNDDVEDLTLPPPRATRTASILVNRITQDHMGEDDEEDDGLAAELEAAFEQEDDRDSGTVGLGISDVQGQRPMQDEEESEVSEEE
jgi:RNA polymerase II transcription elongation factor